MINLNNNPPRCHLKLQKVVFAHNLFNNENGIWLGFWLMISDFFTVGFANSFSKAHCSVTTADNEQIFIQWVHFMLYLAIFSVI